MHYTPFISSNHPCFQELCKEFSYNPTDNELDTNLNLNIPNEQSFTLEKSFILPNEMMRYLVAEARLPDDMPS